MKAPRTPLTRRQFMVRTGCLGALAPAAWADTQGPPAPEIKLPIAEAFDREIEGFMKARNIPGGALAVVKDQRLVYTRGYGWADRDRKVSALPDSLFRIASISKPITGVAVLKLVDAGRLDPDAPAFALLSLKPLPSAENAADGRLAKITVRQLLHHTGGWDRDRGYDPMFLSSKIAQAAGVPSPARQESIIRHMLGQPLDFDPGTRYAYSNFGYCVLGRIIEKISGMEYARFVQDEVLAPAGIRHMRLGASLESGRAAGEVMYYTRDDEREESVFESHPGKVPVPYGGFCLEAMDAHGGWLASAVDLARFARAMDDPVHPPLGKSFLPLLYEPPKPPVSRRPDGLLKDSYYGCGWSVRPVGDAGRANHWHTGSLPGTSTLLVRRWDGLAWAALFNQRSEDPKSPDSDIDAALHRAAAAVTKWPAHDLF